MDWEQQRAEELADLKAVLSTKTGRAFIWKLLEKCKLFESVPIGDSIHLASHISLSDMGKWLLVEIVEASPDMWNKMKSEAIEKIERLKREIDERRDEYDSTD